MTIGDLLFALGIDGSRLEQDVTKEAQKAGDAGAKTLSQRLAGGLKSGAKVVGVAVSGMLALATKGAVELEQVQNDFQSETGASAEEAKRAGQVINKIAGENQLSLESVRDAAIAVHNDLGLTGDAADKATAQFAKFGRVTKQEPVAAVKAFDDILDAWRLTADDSQAVMDALVVSHQKYGGAVADDQAALASLAPVLTAMNGTWQDAVALLDLAKASGLNSADAIAGLNKALGKVKSPEELQKLIDDISNTADPFLRAQKAADLFGQKAGPKLANALAGKSLKDFRIDMNEAAGATDKAADALDQGFGGQARKILSEFGATLRGLGADWGPALTGAAGFATLLSSLGLDTVIEKLGPKAIAAFKEVGQKGGEALVDAAGTATGALGTIIGNNISNRIEAIFAPGQTALGKVWRRIAGSRVVMAAVAGAGAASSIVYSAASAAVALLVAGMRGAWTSLTGSPSFVASVKAAGVTSAGLFSAAATAAFFAAPIVVTWLLVRKGEGDQKNTNDERQAIIDQISQVGEERGKLLADIAQLEQLSRLQKGNTEGVGGFIMGLFGDPNQEKALYDQTVAQLNQLKALLAKQDAFEAAGKAAAAVLGQATRDGWAAEAPRTAESIGDTLSEEFRRYGHVWVSAGKATADAVRDGAAAEAPRTATSIAQTLADEFKSHGGSWIASAHRAGERAMEGVAQGIFDAREKVVDAFDTLKELLKHPLGTLKEEARLAGELTGKLLARGLHSNDEGIRDFSRSTKQYALDQLTELAAKSGHIGAKAAAAIEKGLTSKNATIRRNSADAKLAYLAGLQQYVERGGKLSKDAASAVASGLSSKNGRVRAAAQQIQGIVTGRLNATVPIAHAAGERAGYAFADGVRNAITARMQAGIKIHADAYIRYHDNGKGNAVGGWATAGVPTWVNEHTTNSEIFVPSTSGRFLTHAEAMNALNQGGGAPINITINAGSDVSPVAAHRFGQLVVHEVAAAFRQGGARRGISTSVRP